MTELVQHVVDALSVGSTYALLALGIMGAACQVEPVRVATDTTDAASDRGAEVDPEPARAFRLLQSCLRREQLVVGAIEFRAARLGSGRGGQREREADEQYTHGNSFPPAGRPHLTEVKGKA